MIYSIARTIQFCQDKSNNYENTYKNKVLIPYLDHLHKKGVINLQDFSELFKKYGINSKAQQTLIKILGESMEIKYKIIINKRSFNKANYGEINIILCRFAYEDPSFFMKFFKGYISKHLKMENPKEFLQELNMKVMNLQSKANLDLFKSLVNSDNDDYTNLLDNTNDDDWDDNQDFIEPDF